MTSIDDLPPDLVDELTTAGLDPEHVRDVVRRALDEDLPDHRTDDPTSSSTIAPDARGAGKPHRAIGNLQRIDVDAERGRKQIVDERQKRAVAAAVVQQAAPGQRRDEIARQLEAAAVAPAHERTAAVQLLPCVVARFDCHCSSGAALAGVWRPFSSRSTS